MMRLLKIGNIRLKNRLFLAPMVDVTDLPYRILCRREGAAMAYTEMLNIGSILHANNSKTKNILRTNKEDSPCGVQITGRSVSEFMEVSKKEELGKFNLVDINCGCPSSRIVDNESGSYLLKTPDKIGEMIRVLKDAEFIVTAKIRLGFKNNNVIDVARSVEKAGVDLLTIHARLASERNSKPADWKWISRVRNEVGIPVVGNGGIVDGKSAEKILDICDGAMIASAAIGNPGVFKEILYYLRTGKIREIGWKERIGKLKDYLNLAEKYDVVEMPRIKYLSGNFLKGFDNAAKIRREFMRLANFEDVRKYVDNGNIC